MALDHKLALEYLDHEVLLVLLEDLDPLEQRASQDPLASRGHLGCLGDLDFREARAHLVSLELLDSQELMVSLVARVLLALRVTPDFPGFLVPQASLEDLVAAAQWEQLDCLVQVVSLGPEAAQDLVAHQVSIPSCSIEAKYIAMCQNTGNQFRHRLFFQVHRDHKATREVLDSLEDQDCQDHLDHKAHRVRLDSQEHPASRGDPEAQEEADPLETPEHLDLLDSQDSLDCQGSPAHQVHFIHNNCRDISEIFPAVFGFFFQKDFKTVNPTCHADYVWALQVPSELKVTPEHLVHLASPEDQEALDFLDSQAQLEQQVFPEGQADQAPRDSQDPLVNKEILDPLVSLEDPDNLDSTEVLDLKEQQVSLEFPDSLEDREALDREDSLDRPDQSDHPVREVDPAGLVPRDREVCQICSFLVSSRKT